MNRKNGEKQGEREWCEGNRSPGEGRDAKGRGRGPGREVEGQGEGPGYEAGEERASLREEGKRVRRWRRGEEEACLFKVYTGGAICGDCDMCALFSPAP